MATLLSLLPSLCRTCAALFEEDPPLSPSSTSRDHVSSSSINAASINSSFEMLSTYTDLIVNAAFSSVLWSVILDGGVSLICEMVPIGSTNNTIDRQGVTLWRRRRSNVISDTWMID